MVQSMCLLRNLSHLLMVECGLFEKPSTPGDKEYGLVEKPRTPADGIEYEIFENSSTLADGTEYGFLRHLAHQLMVEYGSE